MKKASILLLVLLIVLGLVGCSSKNYKEALELYENGKYEEAQNIFTKLKNYENSEEMVKKCIYYRALDVLGEDIVDENDRIWFASDVDLEEALTLLKSISEYNDATQLSESINIEQKYREAIELFKNGEFDLAEPLFETVGSDYRNDAYKYIAAIPLLKEYAGTTWKYDDGYEEDGYGNTIWPTITVKINGPYSIDFSETYSDCDWSVYADVTIDAKIIEVGGGITNLHFELEELIPHNEADKKSELSGICALYKNDEYGCTFSNLPRAPYSKITLTSYYGNLTLSEIPYSVDWNTSYLYNGKVYRLEKSS